MVHPIFEIFDSKMVVVPSRMWLLLFHPWVSGAVLAQGPQTQLYKLTPQPAVPETQEWKNGGHSRDCTATILLDMKVFKDGVYHAWG